MSAWMSSFILAILRSFIYGIYLWVLHVLRFVVKCSFYLCRLQGHYVQVQCSIAPISVVLEIFIWVYKNVKI